MPPRNLRNILFVVLVVLAAVAFAGWRLSPQIHDALLAKRPPAPAAGHPGRPRTGRTDPGRTYRAARNPQGGRGAHPGRDEHLAARPQEHLDALPRDRPIVTFCVSGGRAGKAAEVLREHGFEAISGGGIANVRAVLEGIDPAHRP